MTQESHAGQERRKTPRKKVELKVKYTIHIDFAKKSGDFMLDKVHSVDRR